MLRSACVTAVLFSCCQACPIEFMNVTIGDNLVGGFELAPGVSNNRPTFRDAAERTLQHTGETDGRWVISSTDGTPLGYINSWAMHPSHITMVSPLAKWHFLSGEDFLEDGGAGVRCTGPDLSIHLDSKFMPAVRGYYQMTGLRSSDDKPVFVQADAPPLELPKHLFSAGPGRWAISQIPDAAKENWLAYVNTDASLPGEIKWQLEAWQVRSDVKWLKGKVQLTVAGEANHTLAALWAKRTKKQGGKTHMLNNGLEIPLLGLGLGGLIDTEDAVAAGLLFGYGLLNTAEDAGNEEIGKAMKRTKVPRDRFWITTKVAPTNFGFVSTLSSIRASMASFHNSSYIDSYLIQQPDCTSNPVQDCSAVNAQNATWRDSWKALERAYAEGIVLSIGVSNWQQNLLHELLAISSVVPQIMEQLMNSIEQDWDLIREAQDWNILYTAYGSLRNTFDKTFRKELMSENEIQAHDAMYEHVSAIASRVKQSPALVLLRWQVQQGIAVIPRSSTNKNQLENLKSLFSFNLTQEDMDILNVYPEERIAEHGSSIDQQKEIDEWDPENPPSLDDEFDDL